jgi:hypothetical protein
MINTITRPNSGCVSNCYDKFLMNHNDGSYVHLNMKVQLTLKAFYFHQLYV